jgi:hypothetical protein
LPSLVICCLYWILNYLWQVLWEKKYWQTNLRWYNIFTKARCFLLYDDINNYIVYTGTALYIVLILLKNRDELRCFEMVRSSSSISVSSINCIDCTTCLGFSSIFWLNSTSVIQRYLRKKNKDLRSFQTEQY